MDCRTLERQRLSEMSFAIMRDRHGTGLGLFHGPSRPDLTMPYHLGEDAVRLSNEPGNESWDDRFDCPDSLIFQIAAEDRLGTGTMKHRSGRLARPAAIGRQAARKATTTVITWQPGP